MFPRSLGILLVALLAMVTLQVAFAFQNHRLLRELLDELRAQPVSTAGEHAAPPPSAAPRAERSGTPKTPPPAYRSLRQDTASTAPRAPQLRSELAFPGASLRVSPRRGEPRAAPPDPGRESLGRPASPQPTRQEPVEIAPMTMSAGTGPAESAGAADHAPTQPPPPSEPISLGEPPDPAAQDSATNPATATDQPPQTADADEAQASGPSRWQAHGRAVMRIIKDLFAGRYDAVTERFSTDYAANIDRSGLASAIEPIRNAHGGLKELADPTPATRDLGDGLTLYTVPIKLADGHRLTLMVTLDEQDRIHGLLMNESQ